MRSPPKAGSTGGPTVSIGMPLSEVTLTTGGPLIAPGGSGNCSKCSRGNKGSKFHTLTGS